MKVMRPVLFALLGAGLGLAASDFASAQPLPRNFPGGGRVFAPRPGRPPVAVRRAPAVIHPGSPIRRAPRAVIVRPPRVVAPHRVAPRVFLPPVIFGGTVVVERHGRRHDRGFSRDSLVWQDTETLYREDDWTEFTLDCDARGTKLWFEVLEGRIQVDWAEVVFDDGEVQVVEFPERSVGRGIYELLDFRNGRRVDSVRMVARASSREAKLTLWLER